MHRILGHGKKGYESDSRSTVSARVADDIKTLKPDPASGTENPGPLFLAARRFLPSSVTWLPGGFAHPILMQELRGHALDGDFWSSPFTTRDKIQIQLLVAEKYPDLERLRISILSER